MYILRKSVVVFKYLFLVLVFVDIHHGFNKKISIMILLFLFSTVIMINDYVRNKILNKNSKYKYVSLVFTICGAAVLKYFVRGLGASGYIFFSLAELFGVKGKLLKFFLDPWNFIFYSIYFKYRYSQYYRQAIKCGNEHSKLFCCG